MRIWNLTPHHTARLIFATALMLVATAGIRAGSRTPIDTEHSTVTVVVGKSGVFRAFGDDHHIGGAVKQGFVDEDAHMVDILVDARGLRVLDPDASQEHRDQIQARMLGSDVLDANRFPDIHFASGKAEATEAGWTVHGQLQLHGQVRPVTATVQHQGNHYRGSIHLKQTDFGITPVAAAGGTVKVKDDVVVEFDIVTRGAFATGD
jgi:polyisoprenoid-binding protein YceI